MPTIEFNKDTVPSLLMADMVNPNGYNSFGLIDLRDHEQTIYSTFINYVMSDTDINEDDILLCKAKDGALDKVFAPRIVRDGDAIFLQMGANKIPVTVNNKGQFQVGSLSGSLTFPSETKYFAKVKDENGEEVEVPQFDGTLALRPPAREKSDWEFRVSVPLAPHPKRTAYDLQNTLAIIGELMGSEDAADKATLQGELADLPNYFHQAKGKGEGGGDFAPTLKMRDMEVGKYQVTAIKPIDSDKGKSFVMTLDDGRSVWAQGSSLTILKASDLYDEITRRLNNGEGLVLNIMKITKKGEGANEKTYVDHTLRYATPAKTTSEEKSSTPNIRTNAQAAGAAVADRLPTASKTPVGAVADLDDIPF